MNETKTTITTMEINTQQESNGDSNGPISGAVAFYKMEKIKKYLSQEKNYFGISKK